MQGWVRKLLEVLVSMLGLVFLLALVRKLVVAYKSLFISVSWLVEVCMSLVFIWVSELVVVCLFLVFIEPGVVVEADKDLTVDVEEKGVEVGSGALEFKLGCFKRDLLELYC